MRDLKNMKTDDIYKDGNIYSNFKKFNEYKERTGKEAISFKDMEYILKEANAKGEHIYLNTSCGPLFSTDNLTAEDICMKIFGKTLAEQNEFQKKYIKDLEEFGKNLQDNLQDICEEIFGKDCDKKTGPGKIFRKKEDTYLS